jgi:hypothetical protein
MNSFAIRGQYFNFSTTGQWMWDEIKVSLPASADPRDIVERIRKALRRRRGRSSCRAGVEASSLQRRSEPDSAPLPVVSLLTSGFRIRMCRCAM